MSRHLNAEPQPAFVTVPLPESLTVERALTCFENCSSILLLDSAARIRPRDARYSFLTADPVTMVQLSRVHFKDDPLQQLRALQNRLPKNLPAHLPPFIGGVAGLLSYELGEAFESLPRPEIDDFQTPALYAGLFDWCIVWDHIRSSVDAYVIDLRSIDLCSDGNESSSAGNLQTRLNWILDRVNCDSTNSESPDKTTSTRSASSATETSVKSSNVAATSRYPLPGFPAATSSFSKEAYLTAVQRVVDYIRAGDIFQANLSQQLSAEWTQSAIELYRRVRQLNPAPFCALLQTPNFAVVSASPERFLKVTDGRNVETRPIKGTRRRQQSPIADLFTSEELRTSEKDRAENVMIVDLLRNDLSRNCRPGSVQVTGLCEIEVFETVQHLVSTVVGELLPDRDIWDLLAGSFPGGSITGAPKIRAMEIIAELEPTVRGAYCGSLFYCGPRGDFDSSILIRTFTLADGRLQFPVGGGIVADSSPLDEYNETLHKASGMLRVLLGKSKGSHVNSTPTT